MNAILDTLSRLFGHIVFWVVVAPWEQAIRIRAGKHVRRLGPGLHLRIPILDDVFKQSVRLRSAMMMTQTLQTARGTLVISGALGYAIADIEKLFRTLHHADDTLTQIAATRLAAYVLKAEQCTPDEISESVSRDLATEFALYGVADVSVRVSDFAYVRTYRLMNEGRWTHTHSPLTTEKQP